MPVGRICSRLGGRICTGCPHSCRLDNRRRLEKRRKHGMVGKHWDELRIAALERDGRLCQPRLAGCTEIATSVHLDPRLGGNHALATLQDLTSCCAHCHGVLDGPRAHDRRGQAWGRGVASRRGWRPP
jgi:5-methylcytosine-specific restriction endonuclease McrA